MSDKGATIRREYFDKFNNCKLSTMEKWQIEEEITDILYEKGYDLVNVGTAPTRYGYFNCLNCYTNVADKLANEVKKAGFDVILFQNPNKKSLSWIVFPHNLVIELRDHVENFEAIE